MVASDEGADRERANGAAARDVVAGAALVALGVAVGGSAFDGRADALDYVFDGLGLAWIAWAVVRLIANARA